MCGIFAYIGPKNSARVCAAGIKLLEYRGYDSYGIAGIQGANLQFYKDLGKPAELEKILQQRPMQLDLAIAHTRWATHGKPSKENAHPHFDQNQTVAVTHNGIIENHATLRKQLMAEGIRFQTDTDSEVIAQLIAYEYRGDFLGAVQKTLSQLQGFWGLAIIHKDHPDQIITAARENPIAVGLSPDRTEAYISSDVNSFTAPDLDVLFLRNDEIAVVKRSEVQVFDLQSKLIEKSLERLGIENVSISKNGFDHFMLKEIFEQPQTIQQAMHNRFIWDYGIAEFENLRFSSKELLSVKRIIILGCGTSWHAGCIAASLLEDLARIPTTAEISSEFRYRNPIITEDTLVIAISQSGETLDTIASVREAKAKGAKILGICNVRNSTLTREAHDCLFLRAGPEISVCSTKAFTSQLTVLSLFTLLMARLRHLSKEEGQEFLSQLKNLPEVVEQVLHLEPQIKQLAYQYAKYSNVFFLGRHYMYGTSLEAALKLKEISYLNATGYAAGEMKHGPIALVGPELAVIGLCGNRKTFDKMLSSLTEVKSRSARILALTSEDSSELRAIAHDVLVLPGQVIDGLATIPYSVACQLFAYYAARARQTDIDQPRNLAKSVTVE